MQIGSSIIGNILLVDGLKHNLLSISQLSNKGHNIVFDNISCKINWFDNSSCLLSANRVNGVYSVNCDDFAIIISSV